MKTARLRSDKNALELIEETLLLLRGAPAGTFAAYYLGTLPFVLGLLFFFADMSSGADAPARLLPASLALAGAYLWMKCWQSVFAQLLRSHFGLPTTPWSPVRVLRLILVQTAFMPWGWVILPLALAITLPFGWAFAFFQNLTVIGGGDDGAREVLRRCRRQAALWPGQNHLILLILFLLATVVFANLVSAAVLLPRALHTLFGIETIFSRASFSYLNTTFLATMAALTFLAVDPLVKAVYARRCFHGEALRDGRDLLIDIRRLAVAVVLCGAILGAAGVHRAAAAESVKAVAVDPVRLDRRLDKVLEKLEYSWRLPRQHVRRKVESSGFLAKMLKTLGEWLKDAGETVGKALDWLLDKLQGLFPHGEKSRPDRPGTSGWNFFLIYMVAGAGLSVIAIWLWRRRRGAGWAAAQRPAPAVRVVPDLESEEVSADQLPHDQWFDLGRDLLARGEFRLALRAYFLGGLALLAGRGLLVLARAKSNREYLRELQRRAADQPELVGAFARGLDLVEGVWYGSHPAGSETVESFLCDQKGIFGDAGRS